eukprot:3757233-Rhodomonas_salina.1
MGFNPGWRPDRCDEHSLSVRCSRQQQRDGGAEGRASQRGKRESVEGGERWREGGRGEGGGGAGTAEGEARRSSGRGYLARSETVAQRLERAAREARGVACEAAHEGCSGRAMVVKTRAVLDMRPLKQDTPGRVMRVCVCKLRFVH